jgi:glucose uptake protein GlcU
MHVVAATHVLAANVVRAHVIHGLIALVFLVVAITIGAVADARHKRATEAASSRRSEPSAPA